MSKIKVNDNLYFYTDYLSVLPNVFDNIDCKEQLKAIVQLRVNERKQQLLNNFNNNVASLSIAPTGYCEGRCKYCYAKEFYNIKEYLSVENLKKAIDKYNVKLGKGNTIIYGRK